MPAWLPKRPKRTRERKRMPKPKLKPRLRRNRCPRPDRHRSQYDALTAKIAKGAHPDTATGPRAVLGSQRPRKARVLQVYSTPSVRSYALRAEDGSRSA